MRRSLFTGFWADIPARVSLIILALMALTAMAADILPLADPDVVNLSDKFAPIAGDHILGTDALGRDILSRLIYGARASLLTALAAAAATAVLGALYGALAAAFGGKVDGAMMRFCEAWMSIPPEVLLLTVVGLLGPGAEHIFIACLAAKWPWYARMVRMAAERIRGSGFVQFARASGAGPAWF